MKRLFKTSVLISSVVGVVLFTACNNTQQKSSGLEDKHIPQQDSTYACPMHPEVTGKKGDICHKCGMELVAATDENENRVEVELITEPQSIEAGTSTKLTFAFKENDRNVPLDISHERKVHLMIVDENLTWFRHIHPLEQADSTYVVSETFPYGGKYILFADHKPQGVGPTVDKKVITVKGNPNSVKVDLTPNFVSVIDGYTVTLENGDDLKTIRTQALEISVERNKKRLAEKDIEPYLGATAHIAMIGKEDIDFLHIHPTTDKRFPIYAETHIENPGIYRIWVEFQTYGKVHTADFTVNVLQGNEEYQEGGHNHH
ncbi:heavy metal-binding domain-containing protein [Aequorivita sp. SDUM287046]|uniref:Heavy metal-binding domain-containing protein n=1 Tax=Aequorivita aurantiaca TaxID=3053356 RepID=A0ABT8DGZ2_9FLAO|nr:heavy metal-binding domain-containing protein [Aequorivita aurantiaca]MDN3724198.1 heavy metal-binding domain-containing protein [Aequorivita aurantiaca]